MRWLLDANVLLDVRADREPCADKAGVDMIVTRNASDFRGTDLAVRSPEELLARLGDLE